MNAIHPDLRSIARWLPRGVGKLLPLSVMRTLMKYSPQPRAEGVTIVEREIKGVQNEHPARVRVISPIGTSTNATPAMLWLHGGGYIMGDAKQDDAYCASFATRLGMTIVTVDYRLAPEHPYPAQLDDSFAALEFMHREASSLNIDMSRYVIAGVSAGGGLAAGLVLRAHDSKLPPPRLQLLVYPMLDDRTLQREIDASAHRLWDQPSNRFSWECYLGRDRLAQGDVPEYAAPSRRVDLSGLPPAWIGVGSADLFHEENVAYAQRLRDAGVPTTLDVVDGAFHVFDLVVPKAPVSQQFREAQFVAIEQAVRK